MRFIKFFSIAAAVLAVASCNKQIEQPVDGEPTTVTVRVNLPGEVATKGLEDKTQATGTTPVVVNDLKVTLIAAQGGKTITATSPESEREFTFENVRTPLKIEVSVNGGSETELNLSDIVNTGLAAKMYGSTETFNPLGDDNTKLTASVTLNHEYARFEISGIQHVDNGEDCIFNTIDFRGIFLNKTGLTENAAGTEYNSWTEATTPAKIEVGGAFANNGTIFPTPDDNQCYAFNFFTKAQPEIVLAFNNVTAKEGNIAEERYAVIKNFKTATDEPITLQNGYIYRITKVEVSDEYTAPDPEVPVNVTLTATVTVLPWNIVDTDISWE